MKRNDWTAVIRGLGVSAEEFVKQGAAELSDAELARRLTAAGFHTNRHSVQVARIDHGISKAHSGEESWIKVEKSPFVRYDEPPKLAGDCAILGDVELPFHEHEFLNRVLELCQRWGVRQVAFNGDLMHHDKLTTFDPAWQATANPDGLPDAIADTLLALADDIPGKHADRLKEVVERVGRRSLPSAASISEEWKHARKALTSMRQIFKDGATLVMGNHEGRLLRAVQSGIVPDDFKRVLMGDDEWLRTAPYYYGELESGGVHWRFTHPKNTTVIPASVAAKLAEKLGMSCIMGHNHLWGMQQSLSGRHVGIESGCLVDGGRLAYYSQRDTTRPAWQLGAVIVRDGFATLLHPRWSDWKRLMRT